MFFITKKKNIYNVTCQITVRTPNIYIYAPSIFHEVKVNFNRLVRYCFRIPPPSEIQLKLTNTGDISI